MEQKTDSSKSEHESDNEIIVEEEDKYEDCVVIVDDKHIKTKTDIEEQIDTCTDQEWFQSIR